ncbi:NeuD/PglB/VioB family sugar acetyltransferase [Chitinimonas lacunae]|uniref:NeuD/PglB/VioB family sugar acetyltransferase n=1 Tax=Chitinimonas lacunae TaxID=1963018 RepID=A0ABV8MW59_9NEIS
MSAKADLVLVGGGGHCHACIDVVELAGHWHIAGVLDRELAVGTEVLGYPVLGDDERIEELAAKGCAFLIALGQIRTASVRQSLYQRIVAARGRLVTVVSPLAYVSRHARLGVGTIVMHHAVVNACAEIGANTIINTRALVEHDARIGDHCHIATAAVVNGGAEVGTASFVGSQAVLFQGAVVAPGSVVGAGTVVRPLRPGAAV